MSQSIQSFQYISQLFEFFYVSGTYLYHNIIFIYFKLNYCYTIHGVKEIFMNHISQFKNKYS